MEKDYRNTNFKLKDARTKPLSDFKVKPSDKLVQGVIIDNVIRVGTPNTLSLLISVEGFGYTVVHIPVNNMESLKEISKTLK